MTSTPPSLSWLRSPRPTVEAPRPPRSSRQGARDALRELGGFATSPDWLPPGLSREIDAIRQRHVDLVSRLAGRLATPRTCKAASTRGSRARAGRPIALRSGAIRRRTPPPRRDPLPASRRSRRAGMASHRGPCGDLPGGDHHAAPGRTPAHVQAGRRASPGVRPTPGGRAAAAEAREREWLVDRTARWLMDTADGGAMSRQPRPKPETPPTIFDGEDVRLDRPWWRRSDAA